MEGLPSIYAYELPEVPSHRGLLKVGYTVRTAEERVAEQCRTWSNWLVRWRWAN